MQFIEKFNSLYEEFPACAERIREDIRKDIRELDPPVVVKAIENAIQDNLGLFSFDDEEIFTL